MSTRYHRLTIALLTAFLALAVLFVGVGGRPAYADPDPAAPELLLTEIVVTPTGGEFVEIHNPTASVITLTDVYLTDATFAGGDTYYYNIVTGTNAGGGDHSDFHARFPDGATIAPGEYQTIALAGSDDFLATYGVQPTYELYEDGTVADAIPDMREATAGSINNQGGLTNNGEVVILYYWNGDSDLVTDLDYAVWGDTAEAVDKTGVSRDGPDPDVVASTYLADTALASQILLANDAHAFGLSWQRQDLSEGAETASGGNGVNGNDETSEDLVDTWCANQPSPGLAENCDISLEKSVTPGADVRSQQEVTYTLILANNRVTDLVGATISDTLPSEVSFLRWVEQPAGANDNSGSRISWSGALTAGEALTFTFVAENQAASGQVTNRAVYSDAATQASATASYQAAIPVVTIADIQFTVDASGDSPYDGQVVSTEGIVTANFGDDVFIQDGSGPWNGVMLYRPQGSLVVGDYISVTGRVSEYYGLTEFAANAQTAVISSGNSLPAFATIPTGSVEDEAWEGVLIQVENVTVTDPDLGYGEWLIDDGSGGARVDDLGAYTYDPVLSDTLSYVRGPLYYNFNDFKIEPRDDDDIGLVEVTVVKDAPALVAPGDLISYTITVENRLGYALQDLVVEDALPAGTAPAYILDGGSPATVQGLAGVAWPPITLNFQDSLTVRFVVTASNSPTTVVNALYGITATNLPAAVPGSPVTTKVGDALSIHDLQGVGHSSPFGGRVVKAVSGIVTVLHPNGFYMQEPNPDSDEGTSEGIFVFTGSVPPIAPGDAVQVTGVVEEFFPSGAAGLSVTEIGDLPQVTVDSSGNPLPAPQVIGTGGRVPPVVVIDDDNNTSFDPAADGIDFYESLEGMLVQINDAVSVGSTDGGAIPVVGDSGANAQVMADPAGIVIQPGDFNPERIFLDDAIVSSEPQVLPGHSFPGAITGTISYNNSNFVLQNAAPLPAGTPLDLTPPVSTLQGGVEDLLVATFNTLNLDPTDDPAKFDGLAAQIVNHLNAPDIIGLQEIQDNDGETDSGVVSADLTYSTLISAIRTISPALNYDFREIAPVDGQDGGAPGANIRVGFLFRPDRVTFVDRGSGTAVLPTLPVIGSSGVELTASPGRVDPTNSAFDDSRKPLAGEFLFNNQTLFVIVNHFNSKGGDGPLFGSIQPPILETEAQRRQQAQVVNAFVDSILVLDARARIIVLGDLNDFQFSPPLVDLKGAVLTDLIDTLPAEGQYSYIFQGNAQVLDHILISPYLKQMADPAVSILHLNTQSFEAVSDHDPVVARLTIRDVTFGYLPAILKDGSIE